MAWLRRMKKPRWGPGFWKAWLRGRKARSFRLRLFAGGGGLFESFESFLGAEDFGHDDDGGVGIGGGDDVDGEVGPVVSLEVIVDALEAISVVGLDEENVEFLQLIEDFLVREHTALIYFASRSPIGGVIEPDNSSLGSG